ncbi:unnamed protein product [Paramecium octaurelia]|uniref:Reverse transcriptase domain-containing protein n=1 Tax=Paramecium octaurelia TaxID=43137 RepID=A0A8S1WD75_PAROT|nr:unnamed protein product [Paramecium octaurelia]CAD8183818.1 unnamed protein product [Paramecium octaurelia]
MYRFTNWHKKNWNNLRLNPCQISFTSQLGTQVHISRVISRMKSQGSGKNFTFFDLSDAYNTIDREALYNILTMEPEVTGLAKEKLTSSLTCMTNCIFIILLLNKRLD